MQVNETLSEGLKRQFTITVPASDIEGRLTDKLRKLSKEAHLPGFRPGKAPVSLLRKQFGRRVMGEVLEETVNSATQQAMTERELKPALQPRIEITRFEDGEDLEYTLDVEVMPAIETGSFDALELERLIVEVDDAMIEERLQRLADSMKSFADAADEQAAASGDAVVIDFVGSIDGEPFEGGSGEDFQLELGSGQFIPGFEEALTGMRKSEEKTFPLDFPEDYPRADMAGKQAEFKVTVKQVKVPLPTPIDDALAEKLGMENLEALRKALREEAQKELSALSRSRLKRSLLDALAERYDFEVPPGMVEMEFEQIWQQVQADLERQEKTTADLEKPEEELKEEYGKIAERRVRLGLLLSEVGQRNNLSVSQDEVNRAIVEQARRFPGQEQQVFELYQRSEQAQAQLRAPILEDKVCDFIIEMAQVSERKVTLDELAKEPDDDEPVPHAGDGGAG